MFNIIVFLELLSSMLSKLVQEKVNVLLKISLLSDYILVAKKIFNVADKQNGDSRLYSILLKFLLFGLHSYDWTLF